MKDFIYYVKIIPGGTPLRSYQKGGGIYTSLQDALNCVERLKKHGSKVEFYYTGTHWVKDSVISE